MAIDNSGAAFGAIRRRLGYQAPEAGKALPEYDVLRQRMGEQNQIQSGIENDALDRKFAQLGNLNSGARIKISGQLADTQARRLQDAQADLGLREADTKRGLEEADITRSLEEGRFQQQFGAQQQQFALQEKAFGLEEHTKLRGLDLAQQELDMDKQTILFNKALASADLGKYTELLDWIKYFEKRGPKPGQAAMRSRGEIGSPKGANNGRPSYEIKPYKPPSGGGGGTYGG